MELTRDAELAIDTIRAAGGRPLIVGGSVRDWLLGIPSKDIDIEVHGYVEPEAIQKALAKVGKVDAVGMSFGVLKFGYDVDISFPRRDSKTGEGHTGFAIQVDPTMSIEEAMSRRDFTINAMGYDPLTHLVVDPFDGRLDLEGRRLRATSQAFAEDPLRVLRGVQFASRFGFSIEHKTASMCRLLVERFAELSIERVWVEWEKILTKGQSMEAVYSALASTGWIVHFPEWLYSVACEIDSYVLPKVKQFGISGPNRAAIIVAAMFQDRPDEATSFLTRIDAPKWLRVKVTRMLAVKTPALCSEDSAARRVARELGGLPMLFWLIASGFCPGEGFWATASRVDVLHETRKPLLTGRHLIQAGMKPGPGFAAILAVALEMQDEFGWTTTEEAETWFRKEFPRQVVSL